MDEEVKEEHDMKYSELKIKGENSGASSLRLSRNAVDALYNLIDNCRKDKDPPLVKVNGGTDKGGFEWRI